MIKYTHSKMIISHKPICLILMLLSLIAQLTKTKPVKYIPGNICDVALREGTVSRNYTKNRIIDGEDAEDYEFKDHVSLSIFMSKKNKKYVCGGVLIEKTMILTAAHCVLGVTDPKHIVALNLPKAPRFWTEEDYSLTRHAVQFCTSKAYFEVQERTWFDYAIVRLNNPFDFYEVGKISEDVVTFKDDLTAIGIGFTNYDPNDLANCIRPFKLQKLDMLLVECDEFNSGDTHICFTSRNGGDVCYGDSGSPVYNDNDRIVAISSYINDEEQCLHEHKAKSVFANVVDNRDEIDNLLNECRGPTERPQEEEDLDPWGELRKK